MDEVPEIEYTGERMIPGQADEESEFEHLARYHFALSQVEGKRTLDAGCGDGYGSSVLAISASRVIGIDISLDVIDAAAEKYDKPNLSYQVMDVENITLEPSSFGAVVCFEVFEHINQPEKLLAGIRSVLSDDGVILISTPNGALVKSGKPNPYHVREYTLGEFNSILARFFPEDEFEYERYGQFNLRRRGGLAAKAIEGWMKLKRKMGIGKILPDGVSRTIKDANTEPYSLDDFAFTGEYLESSEYFIFVIRGRS